MFNWLLFLYSFVVIDTRHFNGGTIRWIPNNPYENSNTTTITLIQSYYWTYSEIQCANDVPISTPIRSNEISYLECVVDCSTDGSYSKNPVSTLTDCISASAAIGVLKSERSVNVTLAANAHFYASNAGTAWRSLNSPPQLGLEWSILFYVNVRKRPDGFINTPPAAQIVSPQYTIVNRTTHIRIPVSDINEVDGQSTRVDTVDESEPMK